MRSEWTGSRVRGREGWGAGRFLCCTQAGEAKGGGGRDPVVGVRTARTHAATYIPCTVKQFEMTLSLWETTNTSWAVDQCRLKAALLAVWHLPILSVLQQSASVRDSAVVICRNLTAKIRFGVGTAQQRGRSRTKRPERRGVRASAAAPQSPIAVRVTYSY